MDLQSLTKAQVNGRSRIHQGHDRADRRHSRLHLAVFCAYAVLIHLKLANPVLSPASGRCVWIWKIRSATCA